MAFILHDMFDLSFEEIAQIFGRNPAAARQLASRARRRVRGTSPLPEADLRGKQQVVDAFLTASRTGDLPGLLAVLDPAVTVRADLAALNLGASDGLHGATAVANYFSGRAQGARSALVDGTVGIVVAPRGSLLPVVNVTVVDGKIKEINAVADPTMLRTHARGTRLAEHELSFQAVFQLRHGHDGVLSRPALHKKAVGGVSAPDLA